MTSSKTATTTLPYRINGLRSPSSSQTHQTLESHSTMARFTLLLLPLLLAVAAADEIFTATSGAAREPKYKIQFHSADSPFRPDNGQESVAMVTKDGANYMCYLPVVEELRTVRTATQQNSSSVAVGDERKINLKTPDELVDVLKDDCVYRHESWWTYEFCHQKHVRQLRLETDKDARKQEGSSASDRREKVVQEFVLGVFDPEATATFNQNHSDVSKLKDPRSKDASQRYHAHQYTNGTVCDLTNESRETELRFVCSESAVMISSVKEIATCKYVVTIQCPMLCKHPMFQQERPLRHTIHCNEMLKEPSVEDTPSRKGTQVTLITDDSDRYAT